jgi:hypothetical protein
LNNRKVDTGGVAIALLATLLPAVKVKNSPVESASCACGSRNLLLKGRHLSCYFISGPKQPRMLSATSAKLFDFKIISNHQKQGS